MIHNTATIDPKAKISSNVKIGPYCVVGPNVEIGDEVILQSHVHVLGKTKIGKINKIYSFMPILGVCLGHQILGVYFGIKIKVLKIPKHGKISTIKINKNCKIYNNVEKTFKATRYHSLYLEKENFPKIFHIF